MKRLIVGAALMALASGALADGWQASGQRVWIASKEDSRAIIEVGKDAVGMILRETRACKDDNGSLSNLTPGNNLFINDQPIKTVIRCSGGSMIILPQTKDGLNYWGKVIFSGDDFAVSIDSSTVMHFESSKGRKSFDEADRAPNPI